jgi:hypothetical protein
MANVAALVTTIVAMSCSRSESNMAGLMSCSLCVPLLDMTIWQLLTHLGWYQFFSFSPLS